jgi:dUTP pyrophosphatase
MTVKIKKLNEKAIIPTYGTEFSAGADLYACIDGEIAVKPSETVFIGTGLSAEIPEGYGAFIYARSGLACKKGLAPANKVGVIDSDYRGEIKIAIHNHSLDTHTVLPGERIAQMVVAPYIKCDFVVADELEKTERGEGGFGSTGVK